MKPFELYRLVNPQDIKDILSRDNLYKQILEIDNLDSWHPDLTSTHWFAAEREEGIVGILVLQQLTSNTVSFHGGVYSAYRGETTQYVRKLLNNFIPKHLKLITTICDKNKPARGVVESLGFKVSTRIKNGYKNGDLLIYSKPEDN